MSRHQKRSGFGYRSIVCVRNSRGYTLVELLVLIAIIGILVGLLLPYIEGNNLHSALNFNLPCWTIENAALVSNRFHLYNATLWRPAS